MPYRHKIVIGERRDPGIPLVTRGISIHLKLTRGIPFRNASLTHSSHGRRRGDLQR